MYDPMNSTLAQAALKQLAEEQFSYTDTPVETRRGWVRLLIDRLHRKPTAQEAMPASVPAPQPLTNLR
jgi:hypothetical protein